MKTYPTQSLYEASFLLTQGFKLSGKRTDGSKTTLLFEDAPEVQQALMSFYNGDGTASAKSLFDFYRSLKDMVFQR